MAHSLSSKKRIRQNAKRQAANRARRSLLKSTVRKVTEATAGSDRAAADKAFREACMRLDREANRGLIHRNAAARKKSRLAKRLNQMKPAGTT